MSPNIARDRRRRHWRWVYRAAVGVSWLGAATIAAAVLLAILALFAGTADPHGGGLMWAVAVGFLPIGLGILAVGMVLRAIARRQAGPGAPAG